MTDAMTRTAKILVVSDHQELLHLIETSLRREGFTTAAVRSGKDAIAWLAEKDVELMLLDLRLRDMGGMELVDYLASIDRSIPFIIITGEGDERIAVEMMKRGALNYLVKNAKFIGLVPQIVRHALKQISQDKRLATAEKSLRESDARFCVTADLAPALIWTSGPDKRCTWFNRLWLEFTGRTMEQELGNGWANGVHPDDVARCSETYEKAFQARVPFAMEHRLQRQDGDWRWVFHRGIPMEGSGKDFVGFIGSCIDITEKKHAEGALKQSEERYRTLFNTLLEGFCIIEMIYDADGRPVDFCFLEINPAFETQTGLRDAQGKRMRELAPDHEAHWFEIFGNIALTGEPARFIHEARALNRWYEVSAFRFGDAQSRKVAILFNDITESKRASEALRLSEKRERERATELAAILDAVPMPVFIAEDPDCLHIAGNRAADELLRNPRGAEASLTAPEEVRPRHFKAVKDGRTLADHELPCQLAARGFPIQNFEFSLAFDDGTTRDMLAYATPVLNEDGQPRGAIHVLVDITSRNQAELVRSRLAAIVESSGDAIIGRTLDGTITEWNKGAETMLGYTAEETVGRPVLMLIPSDRVDELRLMQEQIQRGEAVQPFETIRIRKDRKPVDVMIQVSPIRDRAGNIVGASSILRDITERKLLEKEVLEISEREQSRIGQDLHDGLCQHLAAIEFRLRGLKQNLEGKSIKQAEETTELARLVRQAIDQTRTLARGLSPVMGADGLINALHELAVQTDKAFDVSCSFTCPAPILFHNSAISTHLYRIAQEAIHNAVRHGRPKFISITLVRVNDRVVLAIRDDGIGIPVKQGKHQGMGLRVMRYRAHMVGGSLVVQREPDGGTSVVCSLNAPEIGRRIRGKRKRPRAVEAIAKS